VTRAPGGSAARTLRLARHASYAPLLASALAVMMARLLVAARLLEVDAFATYSAALLVSGSFCMLGCLGLQTMLQRDMPVLFFQGRSRRAMVLLAQAGVVAAACAAAGGALAFALPGGAAGSVLDRTTIIVGLVHGLSQQVFVLVTVESRSRGLTVLFSGQYVVRSIAVFAAGIGMIAATGSGSAAAAAEAAATLLVSAGVLEGSLRRASTTFAASMRLGGRRFHAIRWRAASALLAVMMATWLVQNADRWMAERSLDVAGFASYAFASNAIVVASAAQMMINAALFPKLARTYAASGAVPAFRSAAGISAALAVAGLVAAPAAWACWDLAVSRWYPQYAVSSTVAPLLIAVGVLRVSDYWSSFLLIVGAETRLLRATAAAALGAVGAWWFLSGSSAAASVASVGWLALSLAGATYLAGMAMAWKESKRCQA